MNCTKILLLVRENIHFMILGLSVQEAFSFVWFSLLSLPLGYYSYTCNYFNCPFRLIIVTCILTWYFTTLTVLQLWSIITKLGIVWHLFLGGHQLFPFTGLSYCPNFQCNSESLGKMEPFRFWRAFSRYQCFTVSDCSRYSIVCSGFI